MRSRSSMSADNTISGTDMTMKNLVENMRLRPAPWFMRLNLGALVPAESSQPPWEIGPISAASS